jgi:hypothetical protein
MFEFSFERVDFWIQFDGTRGGGGTRQSELWCVGRGSVYNGASKARRIASLGARARGRCAIASRAPGPRETAPNETDSLLSWRVR